MSINKTTKQVEAIDLMCSNKTTLIEGGARSGKTFILTYSTIVRALHYPNTWHLLARLRLSHARQSLWLKTIPDVLRALSIYDRVEMNSQDLIVKFPNGSMVLVGGLDDKERTEKILGNEYATIYLNEASQISYDSYEILTTRLNPPKGVPARFWIDYNPPSIQHWGYQIFHKRKFPDGRAVPDNDYAWLKINPTDNKKNISESLIDTLSNLSGSKRKRFLEGEYGTEEGSLWDREWIKYGVPPKTMTRVVVGVDPSGSSTGDEVGIVVAGIDQEGKYWILGDYSLQASPKEWGEEAVLAYTDFSADIIAAEQNFGGEMVEAVITDMGRKSVNVSMVNASRGKAVRAEPISAMYERGEVFHAKEFTSLEDEFCTWKPGEDSKSPNRLDAAVWALTELSGDGSSSDWIG